MNTIISNEFLVARIKHRGAELSGLFHLQHNLEYIWDADPAFWSKSSPVLFPIVGALRNDVYRFAGKEYSLPRHGFAREMDFELETRYTHKAVFVLKSNEDTRKKYPFDFELRLTYELIGESLNVSYSVFNPSSTEMYFSLGAHPAFRVPLTGNKYDDYYLQFETKENSARWPISPEGYIMENPVPFMNDHDKLPLTHELFYEDAVVFKDMKSTTISLRSPNDKHGIRFSFPGFPLFGIWASKDADFVCLEPWCGIADSVNHNGELKEKEGVQKLQAAGIWERSWSVQCF